MSFKDKLNQTMRDLNINQTQLSCMAGIGKSSISQYLSGKNVPTEERQRNIALSLGLEEDYFQSQSEIISIKIERNSEKVQKLLPIDAAKLLGMSQETVRLGLQQGVFPWGYAVVTSVNEDTGKKHWTYFINAKRFAEEERITIREEHDHE